MSPADHLAFGERHPYDGRFPAVDWCHVAARGILSDLKDRCGVGDELGMVDHDIRIELVKSVAAIIREAAKSA